MVGLEHSLLKLALISWVNEPDRDLALEVPDAVKEKLEKKFLKMYFNDDTLADTIIAEQQARKALITSLKTEYPNVEP